MNDKHIQNLIFSKRKQEILKNELQNLNGEKPKYKYNNPKIIDYNKSHLHRDHEYSNNLEDLEIIKQQHLDYLKTTNDKNSINSIKKKITNIEFKINDIKEEQKRIANNEIYKKNLINSLSKEQSDSSKLTNRIASSTFDYNKFDEKTNMGFTLKSPDVIELHRILKSRDYLDDDEFQKNIQKQISDFAIRSNEISNEIKELEKIPGFDSKVKITNLKNQLNMRNKFIEKLNCQPLHLE